MEQRANALPGSWRERFDKVIDFCGSFSWDIDSAQTYDALAQGLLDFLDCDAACIRLMTAAESDLVGMAWQSRSGENEHAVVARVPVTTGRMPWLLETGKPILMNIQEPDDEDVYPEYVSELGVTFAASVPMVAGDGIIGVYDALWYRPLDWTEDDVAYLTGLGRLYGLMMQHERQESHVVELRVIEESKRLTSEIHDNLAQLITTVKLEVEKANYSFERGDYDYLRKDLAGAEKASAKASEVIREEMLSLKDAGSISNHPVQSARQMMERFGARYGIETSLQLDGISERLTVSDRTGFQITRILHEALSNACRHAHAEHVAVTFRGDDAYIHVAVADDGCGFDRARVSPERLGLRIMEERSSLIGGKLTVETAEGRGTTVEFAVPRLA